MKKIDAIVSTFIGLLIGVFFFFLLKNLGIEIPYSWALIVVFPPLTLLGMFIASWLGKRFLILYQAAKFVLVGATNTIVDLGILNLLIFLSGIASGPFFSIFKAITFLVASANSYTWNKYWTFGKVEKGPGPMEVSKFFGTVFIGLLINVAIASLVVNIIGPKFGMTETAWANVGALSATLIAWVWNFLGVKFFVFKK